MTDAHDNRESAKIAVLNILSGNHAGASLEFGMGVFSIGNSFEDDIVLTDASVQPCHAQVSIMKGLVGITGVSGPVQMATQLETGGEPFLQRYPIEFSIGETRLQIERINDGFLTRNSAIAIGGGLCLLAGVAFSGLHSGPSYSALSKAPSEASGMAALRNEKSSNAKPSAADVRQAVKQFSDYLSQHDLASVAASEGAAAVNARGTVFESDQSRWREAQIWFDTNFGQRVPLIPDVAVSTKKEEAVPIHVQAIWAGANPYVMDANGNKYFEGSVVRNGWTIEKIEETRITLQRDKDRLILRL